MSDSKMQFQNTHDSPLLQRNFELQMTSMKLQNENVALRNKLVVEGIEKVSDFACSMIMHSFVAKCLSDS